MRSVPSALLLAVTLAAPTAPAAPPDDARPGEVEAALVALDRLDAAVVLLECRQQPLVEVLDELSEQLPTTVRADWAALDRLSIRRKEPVTLRLRDVPGRSALKSLAGRLGDEFDRPVFEYHAGQMVLTTLAGTATMGVTDVYDVRDLLVDDAAETTLRGVVIGDPVPDEAPPAAVEAPPDAGGDPEPAPVPRAGTPGEALMQILAEHVDPEAWARFGGDRAAISERGGLLLVTAPPTIHRRLREVLRSLRLANPAAVRIEAAVLDVARPDLERATRAAARNGAGSARTLIRSGGARWRTVVEVAPGEELVSESAAGGIDVAFRVRPRHDREAGLLRLELSLTTSEGEDRRSVRTTVSVPLRRGGVLLELPAATSDDEEIVRVLVVATTRR